MILITAMSVKQISVTFENKDSYIKRIEKIWKLRFWDFALLDRSTWSPLGC